MSEPGRRSLNEINGWERGSGPYASTLVKNIETSLDLPLDQLGFHDLRQLLSQDIAPESIVAFILERLRENPYAKCPCGEGHYLDVLQFAEPYWARNQALYTALVKEGFLGRDDR